jgi:hypothetical protein
VGDRCSISLRLPRIYGKTEVEEQTDIRSPREKRPRMRFRPRPRTTEKVVAP